VIALRRGRPGGQNHGLDQRLDPRREHRHRQAAGEDGVPGLQRRPSAQLLHVQGRDELKADVAAEQGHGAEVGAHQRAGAQDARIKAPRR